MTERIMTNPACPSCGEPLAFPLPVRCPECRQVLGSSASGGRTGAFLSQVNAPSGGAASPDTQTLITETSVSKRDSAMLKGALIGLAIGAVLGYLFRPSVPFLGQLPLATVLSGGNNLQGIDSILKGVAESSLHLLLGLTLFGGLLGGGVGASRGDRVLTVQLPAPSRPNVPAAVPAGSTLVVAQHETGAIANPSVIDIGADVSAVEAALGVPTGVLRAGAKTICLYGVVKITYEDGRVTGIE